MSMPGRSCGSPRSSLMRPDTLVPRPMAALPGKRAIVSTVPPQKPSGDSPRLVKLVRMVIAAVGKPARAAGADQVVLA